DSRWHQFSFNTAESKRHARSLHMNVAGVGLKTRPSKIWTQIMTNKVKAKDPFVPFGEILKMYSTHTTIFTL
ncbi:hypothetical protein IRJ41_022059, partial [Triplophysa rosa]